MSAPDEPERWKDYDGNGYDMGFEHAAEGLRRLIGELIFEALEHERLTGLTAFVLTSEEADEIRAMRRARMNEVFERVRAGEKTRD